jgi:WD40 repeat protein
MARVFISHSSRDKEPAERIMAWLSEQGFETPFLDFDKHAGIPPGADWEKTLYREIERSEAVVIIQTPNWLDSKWCFAEFTQARALGKSIFPVIETPTGDTLISPDIQALDLCKDRDGGLEQLSSQLTQIALDAQGGFTWDASRPPYPGLLAFQEEDAALYFGRDDDIRRLIERLNARRAQGGAKLIALLGASGSGKSSLLRAGVIPRLKRAGRNWVVLPPMRPQVRPVDELARSLAVACGGDADWRKLREELNGDNLAETLSDIANDLRVKTAANEAQILLPIDQSEELFGAADPDQARRFFEILNVALSGDQPFIAVMAIRSDYLGLLQSAEGLTARFEEFSLGPMPIARIAQIIEGPARVANLGVDEAFVHQAARDAETEDALPLLAFALRELYDRGSDDNYLSLDEYNALGDAGEGLTPLENAVRRAADDVLAEANPSDEELTALREAFVPAMVRVNDQGEYVRRPARWDDLPAESHDLLERLATARLLIVSQDGDDRMVEVAHEALLRKWPRLRFWLDDAREFLVGKQQLEADLHDWEQAAEEDKTGTLLSGLKLNRARGWFLERPHQLTPEERALIKASIDHADAEERRRQAEQERRLRDAEALAEANRKTAQRTKIGLAIAVMLALLAGIAGAYAFQQQLIAKEAEEDALAKEEIAKQERARAEDQTRKAEEQLARSEQLLYVNHIQSAQRDWETNNAAAAVKKLEATPESFRNWEYEYLRTLFNRHPKALEGHVKAVGIVAFSADGSQILSADWSGTLKLWDVGTGKEQPTPVTGYPAAFNGDGSRIVSASRVGNSFEKTLELWDPRTGERLSTFDGKAGSVHVIAFSPDGGQIVSAARQSNTPKLWDARTGVDRLALEGHFGEVWAVAFSPDSSQIVSASLDHTLKLWDARTGEDKLTIRGHDGPVLAVAFSRDGKRIVSGGSDGIKVWDAKSGVEERLAIKETGTINAVAFSFKGDQIVSGGNDKTVKVWDAHTGNRTMVFTGHNYDVLSVAFSSDGKQIISGAGENYQGELRLWDLRKEPPITNGTYKRVTAVDFNREGDRIASAGWDNAVRVWDAHSGIPQSTIKLHGKGGDLILDLAFSPDGGQIVTGSRQDDYKPNPTVKVWDTGTGAEALPLEGAPSEYCSSVAFSTQRNLIAAGCFNQTNGDQALYVWDARTGDVKWTKDGFDGPVAFNPVGTRVTGGHGSTQVLKLWDTGTAEEAWTIEGESFKGFNQVAFSPDGSEIISGNGDGTLKLWDASTGELTLTFTGHTRSVHAVAFSPDGSRIVSSSQDQTVKLWDAGTGDEILTLEGQSGDSSDLAFSPDGSRIVSGGDDGIKLWEAARSKADSLN